jgi:hypothetical protein
MSSFSDDSHCRFWVRATANSTTIQESFNVTSVSDTATGMMTVTIATDFAAATWVPFITLEAAQADGSVMVPNADNGGIAAGTLLMESWLVGATTEVLTDPTSWCAGGFGGQ